jgi:hypothetical protein
MLKKSFILGPQAGFPVFAGFGFVAKAPIWAVQSGIVAFRETVTIPMKF